MAPTCKLCLRSRTLRQSHIIPEFVYTALYDAKHRFHQLSVSEGESKFEQKGIRDRLLCDDCEQQFGVHEKYVSEVLSGRIPVSSSGKGQFVQITGLDYKHFKLFALSILWRAGVSSDPFFENVKLGSHEEQLRLMLLADDAGPALKYPFIFSGIEEANDAAAPGSIIVQPTQTRFDGHYAYRFVFAGSVWVFLVSNHSLRPPLATPVLNEKGEMLVRVAKLSELTFVTESFATYARAEQDMNSR